MAVKQVPSFVVICDGCGKRCPDPNVDEWASMGPTASDAESFALDCDWHLREKVEFDQQGNEVEISGHHCPDCGPFCAACGGNAGELSGERDYHCRSCWDEIQRREAEAAG